jgi:hypothetical protein
VGNGGEKSRTHTKQTCDVKDMKTSLNTRTAFEIFVEKCVTKPEKTSNICPGRIKVKKKEKLRENQKNQGFLR